MQKQKLSQVQIQKIWLNVVIGNFQDIGNWPPEARFNKNLRCYQNTTNETHSITFVERNPLGKNAGVCKIFTEEELVQWIVGASYGEIFHVMQDYVLTQKNAVQTAKTILAYIAGAKDKSGKYLYRIEQPKDVAFASDKSDCFERLSFDPAQGPTENWDKMMLRIKNSQGLEAFIGSLFSSVPSTRAQYLYIYGPGGSGKSVIAKFLSSVLGRSFSTTSQPSKDDRFFTNTLIGKRLCYVSEASSCFQTTSLFKSWTGENLVRTEAKGKDPVVRKIYTKFMFTSNNPLKIDEKSENTRRAIACEISALDSSERVSEDVILDTLKSEAAAILHKCIAVFESVIVHDEIHTNENAELLKHLAAKTSERFQEIYEECFDVDPTSSIPFGDMRNFYHFYKMSDIEAGDFKRFIEAKGHKRYRPNGSKSRMFHWKGIKWNAQSFFYRRMFLKEN